MRLMERNEYIEEIMDFFDFSRVQKTMEALKWTWANTDEEFPQEYELRKQARGLLYNLVLNPHLYTSACGGFVASRYNDGFSLDFVISKWEACLEE